MTTDQAKLLAGLLVGRWGGGAERLAMFTLVFSDPGVVYEHALTAVKEIILEDREKCPTPNQILGAYHGAKKAATVETASGALPMCHYCLAEGGWHLDHSDTKHPPREACAPYLPTILVRDDANKVLGPAWGHKPACASHGRQISRKEGHGGWEPHHLKQHRDEIRAWRDRWEAEHAQVAAKIIEDNIAGDYKSPAAFVTVVVNAPPTENKATPSDFDPEIDPEVGVTENDAVVPAVSVEPPMTPAEEAAFNARIRF